MRKIPKSEVLEDIRECVRRKGAFNGKLINEEDDLVSRKTIYNKFGSQEDAAEGAGVDLYHPQEKEMVEVPCTWCGSSLDRHPYRVEKYGRCYCDQECQGKWLSENVTGEDHPLYEGGERWVSKFGPMWHKKRKERLEMDGYSCVVCGKSNEEHIEDVGKGLHVHHLIPRKEFINDENKDIEEANTMDNLVTLCSKHHRKVESGLMEVPDNGK